ncbi:MAG: hypothetical protein NXY57DRAFT_656391 [Lentinula lateritia]|nr:MAG: hypothetical protein NXY57DRAFT_656391 [Lentinula lateritia]
MVSKVEPLRLKVRTRKFTAPKRSAFESCDPPFYSFQCTMILVHCIVSMSYVIFLVQVLLMVRYCPCRRLSFFLLPVSYWIMSAPMDLFPMELISDLPSC